MGLGVVGQEVTVEIDLSGTVYGGTPVWTDVTGWVLTVDNGSPIGITWGRQDASSDIGAASCSFVLDNRDGRFTPGLASSPYSPHVKVRARCRVRCDVTVPAGGLSFSPNGDGTTTMTGPAGYVLDRGNGSLLVRTGGFTPNGVGGLVYTAADVVRTVYLFDGLIDSWEASYTNSGMFGVTAVSATDMLGRYGSEVPLRPMLHEEILRDVVLPHDLGNFFFPFNDAGPTLGQLASSSVLFTGLAGAGGPDIAYQNVTGCADPAVTGVGLGGFFSYLSFGGIGLIGGGAAEMFFTTTYTGTSAVLLGSNYPGSVNISIDASGHITDGISTGPFVADGLIHQVYAVEGVGWYVDGGFVGPGPYLVLDYVGLNLVGTVWCLAVYVPTLLPTLDRVAAHLIAARSGFQGESTDQHIARLLNYRTTFGSVLDAGVGTVASHATEGETLQQALYDTAEAEGGVVFADGQARIVLRSRSRMFSPPTALILDASAGQVETSTVFRSGIDYIVNDVRVTPPSGATQRYLDPVSINAIGVEDDDLTLIVDTDAQALGRATWEVQVGTQEQISATQINANLFTIDDPNLVLYLLQAQPLDVVSLENLLVKTPTVTDFMVQGGSFSIAADAFDVSLFTTVIPAGDPY